MQTYLSSMKHEWIALIENTPQSVRKHSAALGRKYSQKLSVEFYNVILSDPEAQAFLTNEQVEKQLKKALARWTEYILSCKSEDVERMIVAQQQIGEVHARIGIPIQIVGMGGRTLKKLIFPLIEELECEPSDKVALCRFIIVSIDLAMEIMSRVFSFSDSNVSRDDENYRIFALLENTEEEKERQNASLLAWESDVIFKVMVETDLTCLRPLSRSDFGLWFNHKGKHYFSGLPETGYIAKLFQELDELVLKARNVPTSPEDRTQRVNLVLQVRNTLSQMSTFLRSLFDEVSRHEVGMDVLTRLLNRRFMPTIFKREISYAIRSGSDLSVMVIDVDKFKQINDNYGHHLGDEVLRKISQVFYSNVRSGDYVFRYGGDEFLIVLTEASEQESRQIAERICTMVNKLSIKTPNGDTLEPTLSIGVAMFSGHPDYERLIQAGDAALYRAKARGRNRVELAGKSE
ncbi:diguanylate cyclase [Citrobacter amalonaticus]|uniref:diguanylate cyclase n=1 Tax=Citrobacter amalonaticus TaxID=35703 RepID=UPI002878E278|nr:diguanylate cyclase [Citrobacter amalonaticus]MDS4036821.1 diguanylate cyclase [Citrobacter amalonaticus]